jgi:Mn-dependent DtxR family transcriptional regulator
MKTNGKTLEPLAQAALLAVYELGAAERAAHIGNIAARLGVSHTEATRALWVLDVAGLAWAERCRLTIPGLALALRLMLRARGSGRFNSTQVSLRRGSAQLERVRTRSRAA